MGFEQPGPNVGVIVLVMSWAVRLLEPENQFLGHEKSPSCTLTWGPDRLHERPYSLLAADMSFISPGQIAFVPYRSLSQRNGSVRAPPPTTTEGISLSFLLSSKKED